MVGIHLNRKTMIYSNERGSVIDAQTEQISIPDFPCMAFDR